MTERVISYLLLLAVTTAVLLVVIIQPRNTAIQKQKIIQKANFSLASMEDIESNPEYILMLACTSNGGVWNGTTCEYPSEVDEATCITAGYAWMNGQCYYSPPSQSSSSETPAVGGISANEELSRRIESQCLAHVEQSGYAPIIKEYGWFNNVRVYANNACTYAYLITNGKFSSNNDLYLISDLLVNNLATHKEDIGMLYTALENAPAQKKGQSLDDYLNPNKDGVAGYLKSVMDVMATFNDLTTDQKINPTYLTEPLPYVTKKAAATYNAAYGTKIISLEEKLLALLPKPEKEEILVVIQKPKPEIKEIEQKKEVIAALQQAKPEAPSTQQRVALLFTKILNKLKGIREQGIEKGITRTTIQRDINAITKDFLHTQKVIKTFNTCLKDGIC